MKLRDLLIPLFTVLSFDAAAIPSLQLGDGSGSWTYDNSDQTWVVSDPSFTMNAFANATTANGGNGKYAWDTAGTAGQYAYLVAAAAPDIGNIDAFDITVTGASLITSGYGNPPLQDPNSLSPHGIYDTYFEVYEFQFDGPIVDIYDVQPGTTGTGKGYIESFSISINSLLAGVSGVHFDLFTVQGDRYDPASTASDNKLVNAFAPFSHDAEYHHTVPEPKMLVLLGLGLIGLGVSRKLVRR